MAKIWDKGKELDALVERFTVGDDYLLDLRLAAADAVASIAHARMLEKVGILSSTQCESLVVELRKIIGKAQSGEFRIERSQEDSHTAIEALLIDALGETGKRIHTGRSRNDQVSASTRLFAREGLLAVRAELLDTAEAFLEFALTYAAVPMPGRTHLQPAMPSTVGLFAASHAELLLDAYESMVTAYRLVNRCPLGAAAGYGVPLPIDRELVASLLGFESIHHNVTAAVGARGHIEWAILTALDQAGVCLSRFATDGILFSMPEFGYFSLPDELCTGSSIMPQKKNPDGLELLRGKSSTLSSFADRVRDLLRGLPAGYNRDVQESKEPLVRGLDLALDMLAIARQAIGSIVVNGERLREAFTSEIFATDEALRRVAAGESFRDAYRAVGASLGDISVDSIDIDALIRQRTATGSPGNPDIESVISLVKKRRGELDRDRKKVSDAVSPLAGTSVSLYAPPREG